MKPHTAYRQLNHCPRAIKQVLDSVIVIAGITWLAGILTLLTLGVYYNG